MHSPIDKFNDWWKTALLNSPLKQKNAICLATVSADGFPNVRFLDLKAVDKEGFKFCSSLSSVKGHEISTNPKVAMTAWWDHIGYQVRVVGIAKDMPSLEADKYWKKRSRHAQITTLSSLQSQVLENVSALRSVIDNTKAQIGDTSIKRPDNWGGYTVVPQRIEFLTFREDRIHLREQYTYTNAQWSKTLLQP